MDRGISVRAECGITEKQRGRNCRDREADERAANEALAKSTAAKAATDRATKLEADAGAQRAKLNDLGPIMTVNGQGSAIAKLFRLPDTEAEFAATVQQLGIAVVVELIIIVCLIAWEILESPRTRTDKMPNGVATTIAFSPKPKLVANNAAAPVGCVKRILADQLEAAPGQRVEVAELAARYRQVCTSEGKRSCDQERFVTEVDVFCRALGIRRRTGVDGCVHLMDVQLVQSAGLSKSLGKHERADHPQLSCG